MGSPGLRTRIRQWVGPFTATRAAKQLSLLMDQIQPDLVHAMRIPFEGMLAARARPQAPFMVSVWGNDFTLHAKSNPWMSNLTRHTLATISALHTDCQRDLRLAISWGFDSSKASLVVPGGGGIQAGIFFPPEHVPLDEQNNQRRFTVVNPRGVRAYIRSDVFFQAIPLVLAEQPKARFFVPRWLWGFVQSSGYKNLVSNQYILIALPNAPGDGKFIAKCKHCGFTKFA